MAKPNHAPRLLQTEEALTVLFCLVDDAYVHLNPRAGRYRSLKRLADSEVIALALFQQLRGIVEPTLVLARRREVLFSPVPRCGGVAPFLVPSKGEEAQALRMEPLRQEILSEMVGEPETLLVDSTLLSVLHPRQVPQGSGFPGAAWVRWGSFSVYGVKLHLLCAANRIPVSYELTPANVAHVSLTEELLAEAALGEGVARRLLGDLAYRSEELRETLAEMGIVLATERSERRRGVRQRVEIALSSLKRVFGLGETLATTLVGLATRIAAKMTAYTYAFLVNRVLGRPQVKINDLWA